MSRTVLDDIWCLTFFCNAELFKKKKNIKFIQAVLNMQIAELGNKDVLQNSTGPSLFDVVVSIKMRRMLKCSYSPQYQLNQICCLRVNTEKHYWEGNRVITSTLRSVRQAKERISFLSATILCSQHIAALFPSLLKGRTLFCEDDLYRKVLVRFYRSSVFLHRKFLSIESSSLRQPAKTVITLTPYPKVSYTYKYTYIDIYKTSKQWLKIFIFLLCCSMLSCIHVL